MTNSNPPGNAEFSRKSFTDSILDSGSGITGESRRGIRVGVGFLSRSGKISAPEMGLASSLVVSPRSSDNQKGVSEPLNSNPSTDCLLKDSEWVREHRDLWLDVVADSCFSSSERVILRILTFESSNSGFNPKLSCDKRILTMSPISPKSSCK